MAKPSVSRKPRVDPIRAALERLAGAQEETQAELRDLAEQVRELAVAQRRTEEHLELLARDVGALTKDVQALTRAVQHIDGRLGNVEGRLLEDRYRDDPFSFFQTVLRRMRVVPKQEIDALASDFIDRGELAEGEREDLLRADVVVYGRPKDAATDAYLVAVVSATIQPHDVARAIRRAELLARLTGKSALPAVAGGSLDADAATVGRTIWRILDGVAVAPGRPVPDPRREQQ